MEEVEEMEGEAGEAGMLGVTLWKYLIIFVSFSFLISLKMFPCGTNPSFTVCFSSSAHIIEGSML